MTDSGEINLHHDPGDVLQLGTPFGRYVLMNRLNVGGMAEVYLAKTISMHGFERFVAIKRILPGVADDPEFVRMFIDEAKLTVQLNHANVAQALELGRIGKTLFIAMEYVSGIDLRAIWEHLALGAAPGEARDKKHELPLAAIVFIISKLCEGLDYAHRKTDAEGRPLGIVHRDISPQNVMVAFDGQIKIIDFGIAKAKVRASRTRVGILKGKFAYMSPEQVSGLELDARSDVFSVGTILYELLTKSRLFKSDSDFATLEKVRYGELFPPRFLNPAIPPKLEAIILKTLRRDRDERTPSAEALQQMLLRFSVESGETCTARDLEALLAQTFSVERQKERERLAQLSELGVAQVATPETLRDTLPEIDHPGETYAAYDTGGFSQALDEPRDEPTEEPSGSAQVTKIVHAPPIEETVEGTVEQVEPTKLRSEQAIPQNEATQIADEENSASVRRAQPTSRSKPAPTRVSREGSRSAARLRQPRFGQESVLVSMATIVAGLLVVFAFWFSGHITASAKLAVEAEPGTAQFFINGKDTGQIATLNEEVAPGDVLLEVRAAGYCSRPVRLRLAAGESYSSHVRLEKRSSGGCQ